MSEPVAPAQLDLGGAVADWPVGSVAVAVVDPSGVVALHDPDGRTYAWASATKLLTALAVLDAAWTGEVDLDERAGPPGATVRHLLAHASGLGLEGDDVLSAPGRRRIYSNRGYEVLAEHLDDRTGVGFGERMRVRVLEPLGMASTTLDGSPAHAATGPIGDLARLGRELLDPRTFPADRLAEAVRPAYPGLSGVLPGFGRQADNAWGLGPEIRDGKSPHWTAPDASPETFGHFGQAGGFLWVDRDAGLACGALSDTRFGPWAARAWPALSAAVLATYA